MNEKRKKTLSLKHKRAIARSRRGKPLSEETRKKIGEAVKAAAERRRAETKEEPKDGTKDGTKEEPKG